MFARAQAKIDSALVGREKTNFLRGQALEELRDSLREENIVARERREARPTPTVSKQERGRESEKIRVCLAHDLARVDG